MKKLTLTIVSAFALTAAAFAQGTLSWNTIAPSSMTAITNSTVYSPLFGGGSTGGGATGLAGQGYATYYYELLYNTSFTGSQVAQPNKAALFGGTWIDTGFEATNSSSAGKLGPIANNPSAVPLGAWVGGIGALGGTTNNIVLVGWSGNLGTSWLVVSNKIANWDYSTPNAFFGETTTGYIVPNIAPAVGATLFNTTATVNGLPILSLNTPLYLLPVPEPTTVALIGLGGLSLLLFRRRQ